MLHAVIYITHLDLQRLPAYPGAEAALDPEYIIFTGVR